MVLWEQICYLSRGELFQIFSNIYERKADFFFCCHVYFPKNSDLSSIRGQLAINCGLISGWSCVEPRVGLKDPYGSLPTWTILWFYEIVSRLKQVHFVFIVSSSWCIFLWLLSGVQKNMCHVEIEGAVGYSKIRVKKQLFTKLSWLPLLQVAFFFLQST